MANESTTGGPLTATLGEQLAGKGRLEAVQGAEGAGGGGGEAPHAGAEVEPRHEGSAPPAERAASPRAGRGAPSRIPWGAVLAACAGWLLAKTVASGLRRPARRIGRLVRRR